jgi:hypothetical protein
MTDECSELIIKNIRKEEKKENGPGQKEMKTGTV